MNNAEFKAHFSKLLTAAGDKADLVVRRTALELQSEMIARSPVDTGRFKGNWNAAVGAANTDISAAPGSDALGRSEAVLQGWKTGQSIFLTQSLPYATRLENGWSKQAPAGMVRLTVGNYTRALAKTVSELK